MARPQAESSRSPWLLIVGGLLAIGMILVLLDRQLQGVGSGGDGGSTPAPLPGPLRPEALDPDEVVRVRLVPIARDREGRPQVEIRLRDRTWHLAYPDPMLGIIETTDAWNALLADCERYCKGFAAAVKAIHEAEPKRTIGVVELRAANLPNAVVELVRDALGDGGIKRSVVVPASGVTVPGGG